MRQDKLKRVDVKFFVVSFAVLVVLFALITYINVENHIESTYDFIKEYSLSLSDSYTRRISSSRAATEVITGLVDNILQMVGDNVSQLGENVESIDLSRIAKESFVDEINVYDKNSIVVNSTSSNMLDWKVYEGDPIYEFLHDERAVFVGEIRANRIVGGLYKYAYVKGDDGSVIQVGIRAERVDKFLEGFALQTLIDDFTGNEFVENVFFTDADYDLVTSSTSKYTDILFSSDDIHEHFMSDEARVGKDFAETGLLHVCAPVFYEGERLGTLTIIWSSHIITSEIKQIIGENVLRFIMISLLMAGVLLYAYHKRRTSVKIAFYDELTGLPNAKYLKEYLPQKIKNCANNKVAVLLFDLFNFNLINLSHGFEYGDFVLQETALVYSKYRAPKDMLFRLEADKFIMVVNDYNTASDLDDICRRVLADCRNPVINNYKHEYVNLKIVIYEVNDPKVSVDRIIHYMSQALEDLKKEASRDYIMYSEEMRSATLREEMIENAMISIIAGDEPERLDVYYQPLLDVRTGRIAGFEALARLKTADLGWISPLEFIDIAERRNLIFSLGNLIMDKTFRFLDTLIKTTDGNIFVSFNISRLQLLREDFIRNVGMFLNKFEVSRGNVVFELTESVLATNYEIIRNNNRRLKDLGILIAADDFGTGYSSLAELHDMELDILKIDRAFIEKIGRIEHLITEDIITMAHRLNMNVVAEGVERKEQREYLVKHDCDILQGYLISKPLPEEEALEFLRGELQSR